MASVFKRKADRRRKGARWTVCYTDEHGRRRTVAAYTDKVASERLASELEDKARQRRDGLIDTKAEAYAVHERRPVSEHLADWRGHLSAKGVTRGTPGKCTARPRMCWWSLPG